jgi:hypothetical protein
MQPSVSRECHRTVEFRTHRQCFQRRWDTNGLIKGSTKEALSDSTRELEIRLIVVIANIQSLDRCM